MQEIKETLDSIWITLVCIQIGLLILIVFLGVKL